MRLASCRLHHCRRHASSSLSSPTIQSTSTDQTFSVPRTFRAPPHPLPPLVDSFGRLHNYLRISITEKCNFRCQYCMPEEGVEVSDQALTVSEIQRVAKLLTRAGVDKIRITGGEPSVRRDFERVVTEVGNVDGLKTLGLTTNGLLVHRHIDTLKKAQVNSINISLDTLRQERFNLMTRRSGFHRVWEAVQLLVAEGFCQVKVNCVVLKGFNDDELEDFVRLTEELPIHVRFIEFMPFAQNGWAKSKLFTKQQILAKLQECFGSDWCHLGFAKCGTSQLYRLRNGVGFIGVIASMTDLFCHSCNRIRLTADGSIKNCLFGTDEFPLNLQSCTDDQVLAAVRTAICRKRLQHGGMDLLHARENLNRPMVRIGG